MPVTVGSRATKMKIGVIGAGRIGATAARLFAEAGHEVVISNSRGPESLRELVVGLGGKARAMTVDDAAAFAEVVLLAVPWHREDAIPRPELVRGKIVIDAMNPYNPEGGFFPLGDSTSSEIVLARMRGAKLVKAFNTIYYEHLAKRGRKDLPVEERHAIYVAGDNAEAKQVVSRLIEDIGFAPVDTGSLREGGRLQQPDSLIYNQTYTAREARAFFRNELHKLVDILPNGALTRVLEMLQNYRTWPPQMVPSLQDPHKRLEQLKQRYMQQLGEHSRRTGQGMVGGFAGGGGMSAEGTGSYGFSTTEGDTATSVTVRYYHGIPLEITERIRFSDDKKKLSCTREIKGPTGEIVKHEDEFEI